MLLQTWFSLALAFSALRGLSDEKKMKKEIENKRFKSPFRKKHSCETYILEPI